MPSVNTIFQFTMQVTHLKGVDVLKLIIVTTFSNVQNRKIAEIRKNSCRPKTEIAARDNLFCQTTGGFRAQV